ADWCRSWRWMRRAEASVDRAMRLFTPGRPSPSASGAGCKMKRLPCTRGLIALTLAVAATAACRKRNENGVGEPVRAARIPSFRADVLPVLQQQCATAEGCHGAKPTDSVRLDLRPSTAYAQLVGVPAQARRGAMRVTPGVPAATFLLDKLSGRLGPREGKSMPVDPDSGAPFDKSPLPGDYVDMVLVPWIVGGAPNN